MPIQPNVNLNKWKRVDYFLFIHKYKIPVMTIVKNTIPDNSYDSKCN